MLLSTFHCHRYVYIHEFTCLHICIFIQLCLIHAIPRAQNEFPSPLLYYHTHCSRLSSTTSSFLITSHSSKGAREPISPSEYMGLCLSLLLVADTFNCPTWWWNAWEQTLSWWSSYSYTIYLHAFTFSRQTSINTWWINFINPPYFCVMITVSKYKICF